MSLIKINTTLELINNFKGSVTVGTIVETLGYSTIGDGGGASWKKTSTTGTVSQSPAQLGDGRLSDKEGNEWTLVANSFLDVKSLGNGFLDYNDTSTSTTPVTIVEDVWTTIPNNGAGAFSNSTYGPAGVTTFMDTTTGAIDPRELTLGDTLLIRNDFTINPNTNNALLEFRYELGAGGGLYTLSTNVGRLDDGSGKNYRFSLKPDLIYMGDTNTRDNLIKLQVRLSTNGTLVNAGSVIQLIRGNL